MKQVEAERYNIAWFKLAECIARREKERALGVYRLLSHSFENSALVHQLQGDILLAFDDSALAIEQFMMAGQLYEEQGQMTQAAIVYDQVATLDPEHEQALTKLVDLYVGMQHHERMMHCIELLCKRLLKKQLYFQLFAYIKQIQLSMTQKAKVLIRLCASALPDNAIDQQVKYQLVQHALDRLMQDSDSLQVFLKKLEVLDERCWLFACEYIKQD